MRVDAGGTVLTPGYSCDAWPFRVPEGGDGSGMGCNSGWMSKHNLSDWRCGHGPGSTGVHIHPIRELAEWFLMG